MIRLLVVALLLSSAACACAATPRLVVVVSIDQFPAEYLDRYQGLFHADGMFLRFLKRGASFPNCHHGHAFTKTGPGHSVLLSGAFPGTTGIVDNDWFDRFANQGRGASVYCVDDPQVQIVGSAKGGLGKSPRNLLVPTLGDVLKLAHRNNRVFGVALKDRASILMAGHTADGVYWFDTSEGNWVTSTYYRAELPGYLRVFNESDAAESYAGKTWELLHPIERYIAYYPDDAKFEGELPGSGRAFPHKLPDRGEKKYLSAMTASPMGNDLTLAAARLVVEAEKLGRGPGIDLLAINLSSNDYVGHMFGPHSLEVQDMTSRTDLQLAEFANFIDKQLAGAPWTMALSSDHGVAPVPEYSAQLRLPAERVAAEVVSGLRSKIEKRLEAEFGSLPKDTSYVQQIDDSAVYLDRGLAQLNGARLSLAQRAVRDTLLDEPRVAAAFIADELASAAGLSARGEAFRRSFHWRRSGDVMFALHPYSIAGKTTATHGSPWAYDTNVPLLFWGAGIARGEHQDRVTPGAMAPTLAKLLHLPVPPSCEVEPLMQALAPAGTPSRRRGK